MRFPCQKKHLELLIQTSKPIQSSKPTNSTRVTFINSIPLLLSKQENQKNKENGGGRRSPSPWRPLRSHPLPRVPLRPPARLARVQGMAPCGGLVPARPGTHQAMAHPSSPEHPNSFHDHHTRLRPPLARVDQNFTHANPRCMPTPRFQFRTLPLLPIQIELVT